MDANSKVRVKDVLCVARALLAVGWNRTGCVDKNGEWCSWNDDVKKYKISHAIAKAMLMLDVPINDYVTGTCLDIWACSRNVKQWESLDATFETHDEVVTWFDRVIARIVS
jgi:hypothetical protein